MVGSGGDRLAGCLLRREVRRRSQHCPGLCELRSLQHPGDSEVGDLDDAVTSDQEVLGLDVAVDEIRGVLMLEPGADLEQELDSSLRLHGGGSGDQVGDRLPLDVLHDDVREPVFLADVVDGNEVRVREPRGNPGLPEETLRENVVGGEGRGEPFDGYLAPQLGPRRARPSPCRPCRASSRRRICSIVALVVVFVVVLVLLALLFALRVRRRRVHDLTGRDLRFELVDRPGEVFEVELRDGLAVDGPRQLGP
jgi:hypothetical protein